VAARRRKEADEGDEEALGIGELADLARSAAMRAIPGSFMRTMVSMGAPLSRYGGLTPASAAALSRALQLLVLPPITERRKIKLTAPQIARRVGRSEDEVRRWANAGLLGPPAEKGTPARWDRAGIDRADLIGFLRGRDITERVIKQAVAEDRLALLVIDETLVHAGKFDAIEVAKRAGVTLDLTLRIWRALGLPVPDPSDKIFSRRDIEALRLVGVLRSVYSDDSIVESASVMGRGLARYASAEVEMFRRELTQPLADAGASEIEIAWRLASLVDLAIPPGAALMEVVHRWHLENAMRSESMSLIEEATGGLPGQINVAVGFADLVGFTAASERLSTLEVAEVATAFMHRAEEVLPASGATVVKGIGDAVMFSAPDVVSAAVAGLNLVERAGGADGVPPCRVGVAYGPVLRRYADYFGRTVNVASRLCAVAPEGRVFVLEPNPPPSTGEMQKAGLRVARRHKLLVRGLDQRVPTLEIARA
jgi:adenylate cyclase